MKTLGIDTANSVCAVAVITDGAALAPVADRLPRGQAERLLPMIGQALAAAGLAYADIDRYAVTVGPGAFTGLRVGLAAARGLALANGVPLVGVSALEATARAALEAARADAQAPRPVLVLLDSRREDVYAQAFDATGAALTAPAAVMPADLAALAASAFGAGAASWWVGDGLAPLAPLADGLPPGADALPPGADALALADGAVALAAARLAAEVPTALLDRYPPDPFYIRPPDVTLPPEAKGATPAGDGV